MKKLTEGQKSIIKQMQAGKVIRHNIMSNTKPCYLVLINKDGLEYSRNKITVSERIVKFLLSEGYTYEFFINQAQKQYNLTEAGKSIVL